MGFLYLFFSPFEEVIGEQEACCCPRKLVHRCMDDEGGFAAGCPLACKDVREAIESLVPRRPCVVFFCYIYLSLDHPGCVLLMAVLRFGVNW